MNSKNSKTSSFHSLALNLTGKMEELSKMLRGDGCAELSYPSNYYKWQNVKQFIQKHKFKLSRRKWDKEFELPDGGSVRSMIFYQIFKIILSISSGIMRR